MNAITPNPVATTTAGKTHSPVVATPEREFSTLNGWSMLALNLFLILFGAWLVFHPVYATNRYGSPFSPGELLAGFLTMALAVFSFCGHFTLQPNEGRVLILFGSYKGTTRKSGFHWTNPLFTKRLVSLRARNLLSEKLKVNDKRGNPIEIAAVVVWRIENTAQACFDVQDCESYVRIQSESAIRHLASSYAYDHGEDHEITLRSGTEEISAALSAELQDRLSKAGVRVEEARLTHLAYAPEIAQAMLRRQQAEAVIAARQKIVQGAVSMVEMALRELKSRQVIDLDDERKAAMVSNLLVVLCGESEVSPVVNAGTLYT